MYTSTKQQKKHFVPVLAVFVTAMFLVAPSVSFAASIDVRPDYVGLNPNNTIGVAGDAAPGYSTGSIASDGSGKSSFYFTPDQLFGQDITLGNIESISYWTKKGSTHDINPADWYLTIYTTPYSEDVSDATWYGDRIGSEPYFSDNLAAPADMWNEWSTDGEINTLRFFESTAGAPGANFGSYTDLDWDTFVAGNALSGEAYATRDVLYITVQTGSEWADGFTGQVDGLEITLTDNTVGEVNFEAEFVASLEITKPLESTTVSGVVDFEAIYTDEDGDDAIQWAVRGGTCAAGTGTVAGNVDGYSTPFNWDGETFTASIDMSGFADGEYCFVVNPTEDTGDDNLRAAREFTLDQTAPVVDIDSPADGGVVSGMVDIDGTVLDDNLSHYNVSLYPAGADVNDFSLRLDGQTVYGSEITSTATLWSFDSTAYADGDYQIRLAARDLAGNRDLITPDVGGDDSVHVIQITIANDLVAPTDPTSKFMCMKGGWEDFGFKNQGQCIRFVETGKDSR